jgi:von Willebrand factor type A domain-containing protein
VLRRLALGVAAVLACAGRAEAQLDPLLALKEMPPNVIIVFDNSFRMLDDGTGNYYDVKTYSRSDDVTVANALGVSTSNPTYRRIYRGLGFELVQSSTAKYVTTDIVAVPSTAASYSTFWSPTRFQMAKSGLAQAVGENPSLVRWGLLKLRQNTPAWRNTTTTTGCDKPVRVTGNAALSSVGDSTPCAGGGLGLGGARFVNYAPSVAGPNYVLETGGNPVLYAVGSASATTNILTALTATVGTGVLVPAGMETAAYGDRPISHALDDARAQAVAAMTADSCRACRNTVIVLVTGGKDDGDPVYQDTHDPVAVASTFASVSASGSSRRVPIVVVGVAPAAADEAELQSIATASGGRYFKATSASQVAAAVNYAVQLGFAKALNLDANTSSEFTFVSPIVGTVNLVDAKSSTGATLPNTDVASTAGPTAGQPLPQRGNFLLTSGFSLPGFEGRLRAFRVYKPVADSTKAVGWRFEKDGTKLWPDLDGRPSLAGQARTPIDPDSRNIYTYIPNSTGGGTMVAFTLAESATLAPHLGGADPASLIPFVRQQKLGAVIGSTPAILDAPSLDPPPDADYGYAASAGTYAYTYRNRRSMIFFGGNDGMIHAVDARTGYEVWAFIPYNLLPKLRTLQDGQSVERFDYFVDSSPKIAEVKLSGAWRTVLVIGQGYGGTFYQAFDVTQAGMGVAPDADGLSAVSSMLSEFDSPGERISFSWAFPNYTSFDPNINFTASVVTGFPGEQVRLYGDLNSSATAVEKRVGFTFSDPAVGPLTADRSVTAVITGSGYFPDIETSASLQRGGGSAPAAGRSFFLLDAATGKPIGNASGGSCSGTGCYDVGDASNGRKNALQADLTASGDFGSPVVVRAYGGDIDGKYWRFTFTSAGAITATVLTDTNQPIYASSALLFVGSADRYLFFGTGSDLLSAAAPGGGGSGSGTAFKLFGIKDGTSSGSVVFSKDLSPKVTSTGPVTNGERPTASPTVAGDIVFFTTTTDASTMVCSDATTQLYAFTYLGSAAYDSNGDGSVAPNENPVVATSVGRGTAPFIVDQHLFLGTTSGSDAGVTILGDSADFNNGVGQVGVRILSWREIR